jgi:hypothetical protein
MDRLLHLINTQLKSISSDFKELKQIEISSILHFWKQSKSLFQFLENLPTSSSIYLYKELYHLLENALKVDVYLNDHSVPELSEYEVLATSVLELDVIYKLSNKNQGSSCFNPLPSPDIFEGIFQFLRTLKNQCISEYLAYLNQKISLDDSQLPLFFIPEHFESFDLPQTQDHSSMYTFFQPIENQELSTYLRASFPKEARVLCNHLEQFDQDQSTLTEWWLTQCTLETNWIDQVHLHWQEYAESQDSFKDIEWKTDLWPFIHIHLFEWVKKELKVLQTKVIQYRVQWLFETLITHSRPKDQKIGSFVFHPQDPSKITVIFISRDGRLLAQRDLVWDSLNLDTLSSVFESIRIRTLVCSSVLTPLESEVVEFLKETYNIYPINPIGLDPVVRPLNLSQEAQKALRLGQRYVAPLRFWIRGNLTELAQSVLNEREFQFLEDQNELESLFDLLKEQNELKWVYFRRKREQREQAKHKKLGKSSRSRSNRVKMDTDQFKSKSVLSKESKSKESKSKESKSKSTKQIERSTINQLDQLFSKSKK